ncbi:MAG: class I SAM-dependent methyltransferase [FCB group bacterium]|nr:class I SAM-dependent methyltransferase [FCB group bacterium]
MDMLFELHSGLSQQAPGNNSSTLRALSMMTSPSHTPRILDIGCGPGRQTIALARITGAKIVGVDIHQPFLDDLKMRAARAGLTDQVAAENCSMSEMDFEKDSFDIIWSEGAIYIIGFNNGLTEWKKFLKPDGFMALTELSWLTDDPPPEAKNYWLAEYPAMKTIQQNIETIEKAGFTFVDSFTLPDSAWWENYYIPLEKKIERFREKYATDREALEFAESSQAEIDLFREYSNSYGYVFYIMKKQ